MKDTKKNEWANPTIIIAIGGLIVSLITNYSQYNQNKTANDKLIAEQEVANNLKKEKQSYTDEQKKQYAELEDRIKLLRENSRLQAIGVTLQDNDQRQRAIDNQQENSAELSRLEGQSAILKQQINDLLFK